MQPRIFYNDACITLVWQCISYSESGVYREGMDQWLLAVTSGLAAKDLEVAGAGPVHCHFPFAVFPHHV